MSKQEFSVAELQRIAGLHKWRTPESWLMDWAASEIERLTAELTACRQECEKLEKAAKHWNGLYRKVCLDRQDDAARYGEQIESAEAHLTELQAKLTKMEDEWYPSNHMDAVEERTIGPLRKQLTELQAKYTGAIEALEIAQDFLTSTKETNLPWDMNSVPLNKIPEALVSTPQSVLNLMAVLEAVGNWESTTWMEDISVTEDRLRKAYRKWTGEKP